MSNKWNDFVAKSAPKNPFAKMQAPTSETQQSEDSEAAASGTIQSSITKAKNFVLGRQEPEPQGWLKIFNCLPNDKKMVYALISFGIAAFFLLMCFFLLAEIILVPAKFVMCFTLAIVATLFGLAFLTGPRIYVKKLFIEKNLIASVCLISSTLLSLWFSMIVESYIWSIVFCIVQLNAVIFYFCNLNAATAGTLKWVGNGIISFVKNLFRNV